VNLFYEVSQGLVFLPLSFGESLLQAATSFAFAKRRGAKNLNEGFLKGFGSFSFILIELFCLMFF